jgi:hypothetical protein
MDLKERSLYHQIHPTKLITDWGSTVPLLYLIWQQNLVWGLVAAFVPSIIASFIIIQYVNLEKYKYSSFGKYVAKYMTRPIQATRFVGLIIMLAGAWYHTVLLIPLGLIVIILAWLRGCFAIATKC